ncbi:MAG: ADOP family duplicated permease [Gemmatimonadota bacterium]|jgi:predicted permease
MSIPPRLAVLALRRICSAEALAEVEGDLFEAFSFWTETRGSGFARRRYWQEVACLAFWRWVGAWRRFRDRGRAFLSDSPTPGGRPPRRGSSASRGARSPQTGGGGGWPRDLLLDIRFGVRRLATNPLSSGIAIVLLAVGIGGNTTVFTVVQETLRKAPPLIENPHELVGLDWVLGGNLGTVFGYYDYEFYRDQGETFADVLAYGGFPGSQGRRTDDGGGEVVVGQGDAVEQAGAWVVSGNYFRLLGVPMALGAGFSPEVQAGETGVPEVILSHGYWSRTLGGDPSILDRPLFLNGAPFRVAGVTPRDFRGVNPGEPIPDLFVPILSAEAISLGFSDALRRFQADGSPSASRFLRLVARLAPGMDLATAQASISVLQGRWEDEFTSWAQTVYGNTYRVQIRPDFSMAPFESRLLRRQLYFLWFVVGAVFLIACTNLAILLLASASGREREMGIRASLGAGRKRLLSQLITESLILALLGGAAGLGLAYLAPRAITATVSMKIQTALTPDASVVIFALLLSTLAAVLFGTAPAWSLSKADVSTLLQRPGQGRTRARFRGGLVVIQTALSILLLIGGGLLVRSVQALQRLDLGFEPSNRLVMGVQLENNGYTEEDGGAFVLAALDRLRQVPGVQAVSTCNRLPFLGSNTWTFTAPGTDFSENGMRTRFNLAGPDYFETMGISILSGRAFSPDDAPGTPLVAIINEVFAQRMWPGQDPLGKTLNFLDQSAEVVGVAETAVYNSVTEAPQTHAYFPSLQLYQGRQNFVLHTEASPATMVEPVDRALRELDPNLAIAPMTLESLVESQVSSFRIWAALIGGCAGIALFLALVGLYGVQSYLVSRRTREIGIRIALGAEGGSVVLGVVKTGLIMGGLGAILGVGAALALVRLIQGALFGVAPTDPLVFSVVPGLLLLGCMVASLVPAMRASTINPVEALAKE